MNGHRAASLLASRALGLTIVELLIVIAIVGIVAGLSAPTYVGWRADSRNAEAVRAVEQAIAVARAEAKRRASSVTVAFERDATVVSGPIGDVTIPNGGFIVADADVNLGFNGVLGVQTDFEVLSFGVRTGSGLFERTATVSVIPPLGKTAVVR